jgi:hypothetical protein
MTVAPKNIPFTLTLYEVPRPPESNTWADHLRWCVAVMDHDDADLRFTASLLSHALGGGLTDRQRPYADKIIRRVRAMWEEGRLRAQQTEPRRAAADEDLASIEPAGKA